tara:strand:+ start:2177 stop:3097 length:921 start_codon:yes stop_codon:yes gene_type:complete
VGESEASLTIKKAWDKGIRYFDTAPLYGGGLGEHRVGCVIRSKKRESYSLSTKVGVILKSLHPQTSYHPSVERHLPFEICYDYSYDGTLRSIEDSLQRLGLNRIDIAVIHDIDVLTHGSEKQPMIFREAMKGAYPALERLKSEGIVRAIGVGVSSWKICQDSALVGDFDCFILAGQYTLLDQEPLKTFLPLCESRKINIIAAAPYGTGILAYGAVPGAQYRHSDASPKIFEKTRQIQQICTTYKIPLAAAALQFPLGHPNVVSVLPGPRTAAQVDNSVAAFHKKIPLDFWQELKDAKLINPESPCV